MALYKRCGCGKKPAKRHTRHFGNWIYDYRENGRSGRRIRVNLGTTDKRQAEKLKGRILEAMDQGRDPSLRVIKARPWRDVVKEFIEKHVGAHVKARRASARVRATDLAGRDRAWGVLAKNSLRPDYARSESQSIGGEVGFLGQKRPSNSPNDPEKEHRHLIMLRNRNRCRGMLGLAQVSESKGRTRLLIGTVPLLFTCRHTRP